MQLQKYSKDLEALVSAAEYNHQYELEIVLQNMYSNKINQDKFFNVLKRLHSDKKVYLKNEEEFLDITIDSVRFTIIGNSNIIKYCQSEDMSNIDFNNEE